MSAKLNEEDFVLWGTEVKQWTRRRPSYWAKKTALVLAWIVFGSIGFVLLCIGLAWLISVG